MAKMTGKINKRKKGILKEKPWLEEEKNNLPKNANNPNKTGIKLIIKPRQAPILATDKMFTFLISYIFNGLTLAKFFL